MFYKKTVILFLIGILFVPVGNVYGHGLGLETIPSIDINGKEISVTVETPLSFENSNNKQITITAIEDETKENVKNITYSIGLIHEGNLIFQDHFFSADGNLAINVKSSQDEAITIHGEQDSILGAWYASELQPLEITGPLFLSGGLYSFEITIKSIDEPTNVLENIETFVADVSISETTKHSQKSLENEDVTFRMKSYFDSISTFEYNPTEKTVTFEMPFDWSERKMSHIPVVHEEVHFPKNFEEFLYPNYVGSVNGVELFKSSVTIDDYTEDHERIVHFVLLQDHIRYLKNQQQKVTDELSDTMIFTLTASEEFHFPLTAYTKDEQFQIDLSWDPLEIEPDKNTKFVFTIRDGATGEPLRHSSYDFVIVQSGKVIHKVSDSVSVGGGFEDYTFTEEQTGPTIIRFENIRGTGLDTEFGLVVVPEFGSIVIFVLVVSILSVIILSKKNFLMSLPRI